jgi:hypothetical protein
MVQEVAIDVLKREGLDIISVKEPNNFLDTLFSKLVRQLIAALNQFVRSELIARLKEARERQLQVTTRKTLDGAPKVTGTTSSLEVVPNLVNVGVVFGCAMVEICSPICYWAVHGVCHWGAPLSVFNSDGKFGAVSNSQTCLVFKRCWNNAIVQFECVTKIVHVEQFWG